MVFVALTASRQALLDVAQMADKVCSLTKFSSAAMWTEPTADKGWRQLVVEARTRAAVQSRSTALLKVEGRGDDWPHVDVSASGLMKIVAAVSHADRVGVSFTEASRLRKSKDAAAVVFTAPRASHRLAAFDCDWSLTWPQRVDAYHTIAAPDLLRMLRSAKSSAGDAIDGDDKYQLDVLAIDLAEAGQRKASAVGTNGARFVAITKPGKSSGGFAPPHPLLLDGRSTAALDMLCDRAGEVELWLDGNCAVASIRGHRLLLPTLHGRYPTWRSVIDRSADNGTKFKAVAGELLRTVKLAAVCADDVEGCCGIDLTLLQNVLAIESAPSSFGTSSCSVDVKTEGWKGSVELRLDARPVRQFLALLKPDDVVEGRLARQGGIYLACGDHRFTLAPLFDDNRREVEDEEADAVGVY